MADTVYSYTHVPTLQAFANSNAFIRGVQGPFGSGKSSGCTVEFLRRGLRQKPGPDGIRRTRFAAIRNSYPQLKDTTIRTVHQWFPPGIYGDWKESDHSFTLKQFDKCEIEILFRALDRPDQVSNLLSLELTGAWVNEAREIPWAIIEALQGRVGRFPSANQGGVSWDGIWMDTNPPDVDSEWYNFFEDWPNTIEGAGQLAKFKAQHGRPFLEIFRQPSGLAKDAENLANLPGGRGYYDRLVQGKSDEWVKVYVHGEYGFVMDGKPVYAEYSDDLHCKDVNPIPGRPIYRGYDFGLTPACVFAQSLPDGRLLVFDEIISDDMGIDRFADIVIEHSSTCFPHGASFIDLGDPAGQQRAQTDEKTCFQILQAKGINIEPGLQTLAIRLESVRKPLRAIVLGKPQFVLNPRCKELRKGFMGGYSYRRLRVSGERYGAEPDKNKWSHPHDALQYVASKIYGGGLTERNQGYDEPHSRFAELLDDATRSEVTGY